MKNAVILVFLIIVSIAIISLPIYICVNFALLVFHIPYHLTIWQALALSLILAIIKSPKDKGGD